MSAMLRVLLVEDDPEQSLLYSLLLRRAGYQVTTAPYAAAALALLRDSRFDLLVTDWFLPEMKGDSLVSEVRQRFPALRTILMSNRADVSTAARTCGADAWFRKHDLDKRVDDIARKLLPPQPAN